MKKALLIGLLFSNLIISPTNKSPLQRTGEILVGITILTALTEETKLTKIFGSAALFCFILKSALSE